MNRKDDTSGLDRSVIDPDSVVIRSLLVADVGERYVGWLNDPQTNRFLEVRYGVPHTIESVREFVQDCVDSDRIHLGIFVDDKHVGNVTCSPDYANKHATIAFLIGEQDFLGRGLAKMAVGSTLNYLFQDLDFHRVEASAYANHDASLGLMESLGFVREGVMKDRFLFEDEFVDDVMVAILADQWRHSASKTVIVRVNEK